MKNLINLSVMFFFFSTIAFSHGNTTPDVNTGDIIIELKSGCNSTYKYGDFTIKVRSCNGISGSAYYQGHWIGDLSFSDNGKGMYKAHVESTMAGAKVYINKSNGQVSFKYGIPNPGDSFKIKYTSRIIL